MNAAPLAARDGTPLHLREWRVSAPRGTVLVVHGLGEHIGRYEHVAARLNAAGWNVAGHDQRGHGASGGPRGAIAHGDDLLADLAVVIDALRARGTAGPLVLLGHSMGGLVAARFALGAPRAAGSRDDDAGGSAAEAGAESWARGLDALVLSSPALDPGMNALQKALLALLGPLAPNLAIGNGLKPAWISRDPQVVRAYERDPLVHDRITPRLVRFIVDAGIAVRAAAPRWCVPTLLMWAGADRCVAPAGSAAFAAAAPRGIVAAREFPALFHEIFNEPERDEPLRLMTDWLAVRASAVAA